MTHGSILSGPNCCEHQRGHRPLHPQGHELLHRGVRHVPDGLPHVRVPLDPVPESHAEVGDGSGKPHRHDLPRSAHHDHGHPTSRRRDGRCEIMALNNVLTQIK